MPANERSNQSVLLLHRLTARRLARSTVLTLIFVCGGAVWEPTAAESVPPATTTLPVELIPQEADNWCWAAAAQMVMNAVGHDSVPQCEQAMRDEPGWPEFWKFGYSATVVPEGHALTWSQIQDQIARQRKPFVWAYRYPNKCLAHMVVVVGYRTTNAGVKSLKCYDPAPTGAGACWYITYDEYTNGCAGIHWRHYLDVTKVGPGVPPIPKPECDARRDSVVPNSEQIKPKSYATSIKENKS